MTDVFKDENNFDVLAGFLRNNNSITNLEMANVNMRTRNAIPLLIALATCPSLKSINLEFNHLGTPAILQLAQLMEYHPSLVEINFGRQYDTIAVEGERAIANALSQNSSILQIDYKFRDKEVAAFVESALRRNKRTKMSESSFRNTLTRRSSMNARDSIRERSNRGL